MRQLSMAQAICEALNQEMSSDESIFLIGEDIGKYGGCFKVTKGLYKKYGERRVIDTPISEGLIVGASVGAAMTKLRPVAEIMFMDFITVAMDPLVNQAAKIHYMSGGKAKVPMVLRMPFGGGVSGAAQHSQSLESWFFHTPGLKVVSPSTAYDAKGLLISSIRDNNPVVFLEHKLLYGSKSEVPEKIYTIDLGKADVKRRGKDVTVIATSLMVHKALNVAKKIEKQGISLEVIDPRSILPLDVTTIINSIKKTHRALVVHEACQWGGFGGEIASQIIEKAFDDLDAPVLRVGSKSAPIPYNWDLEKEIIPQEEDIENAINTLLAGTS